MWYIYTNTYRCYTYCTAPQRSPYKCWEDRQYKDTYIVVYSGKSSSMRTHICLHNSHFFHFILVPSAYYRAPELVVRRWALVVREAWPQQRLQQECSYSRFSRCRS